MARQTKRVIIEADGRDKGKTFELLEMPADQGERWATRLILALANAGSKLPDGALEVGGMVGLEISWRNVLVMGIKALQGLSEPAIRPLLDEMKHCVKFVPPVPGAPLQSIYPGENSQIEEISTWYTIYVEVFHLHLGFSLAGVISTTGSTPEPPPAS